jgi:hypothetical protein
MFTAIMWGCTALVVLLGVAVWLRTRNISFPIGFAFLYYWSLYGAWAVIDDRSGGDSGKRYSYLENRLFSVTLDDAYLWTILLYTLFIVAVQVTILILVKSSIIRTAEPARPFQISHAVIIAISVIAGVSSYLLIRDSLDTAFKSGWSAYHHTRWTANPFFSLHQELNRLALTPAAVGIGVLASGRDVRFVIGSSGGAAVRLAYATVVLFMIAFLSVLGNKNELVVASILGILVYAANCRRPRWLLIGASGVCALTLMYVFDATRGVPLNRLAEAIVDPELWHPAHALEFVGSSNEAFGPHFSLYGALAHSVPITYGYSFLSLGASVIPRVLWESRPDDIYVHYASSVGAVSGQGYTIHHAAGWYLNGGMPAVMLGGWVLGFLWTKAHDGFVAQAAERRPWLRVLRFLAPWTIAANLPPLIRVGIEGYKGFTLEAFVIPVAAITIASYRWTIRAR